MSNTMYGVSTCSCFFWFIWPHPAVLIGTLSTSCVGTMLSCLRSNSLLQVKYAHQSLNCLSELIYYWNHLNGRFYWFFFSFLVFGPQPFYFGAQVIPWPLLGDSLPVSGGCCEGYKFSAWFACTCTLLMSYFSRPVLFLNLRQITQLKE